MVKVFLAWRMDCLLQLATDRLTAGASTMVSNYFFLALRVSSLLKSNGTTEDLNINATNEMMLLSDSPSCILSLVTAELRDAPDYFALTPLPQQPNEPTRSLR